MNKPSCNTEYNALTDVVICPPTHMSIKEVINSIQAHYKQDNIHIPTALKQHQGLKDVLVTNGVNVVDLEADSQYPEQVFTRDIGFVIDTTLYLASLERPIRQGEEQCLKRVANDHQLHYKQITGETIEGGDVVLAGDDIYIGSSSRTSAGVIKKLEEHHPDKTFRTIQFDSSYLHLDCVFNPISNDTALIYSPAIDSADVTFLKEKYTCIEVSKEEQFSLAVNVLSLGHKKIVVLPENKQTNAKLHALGFHLIEVPFSEIIKSGGSFRCVTMPLHRS